MSRNLHTNFVTALQTKDLKPVYFVFIELFQFPEEVTSLILIDLREGSSLVS